MHGHDGGRLSEVCNVVQRLTGQLPVVLHEQPDGGQTIIEKFETHADGVAFAVVILTGDDLGHAVGTPVDQPRARQNVVFEGGYFIGKLGRPRVVFLYEDGVELPSDLSGVIYEKLDSSGRWQYELGKELRHAGIGADLNRL